MPIPHLPKPDYFTNAQSSKIELPADELRELIRRDNGAAISYLLQWTLLLAAAAALVWAGGDSIWRWPAMLVLGVVLTVPAYALSHEAAHNTVFKQRWANTMLLWVTSFIYMEEPLHRQHTHTNHHAYTWHVDVDSQMPFATPMTFKNWLLEVSGVALMMFHVRTMLQLVLAKPALIVQQVSPAKDLPKMIRNARLMLLAYGLLGYLIVGLGQAWLLWYLVLPRLLGAPVMLMFTLIQHVEMAEDSPSIVDSTRSFETNWLGRFLYCNMNCHIEHHVYLAVPFYKLPQLGAALADQLPQPDPGFWRTNWQVLVVVLKRSLGGYTKAASIRQAPHMITTGKVKKISSATM